MINRKTLGALVLLVLVMTAAAVWRLSHLFDWAHLPVGAGTRSGLYLFVPPLAMLLVIVVFQASGWLIAGPQEALEARRRWSAPVLIGSALILTVCTVIMIARSLGYGLGLNVSAVARAAVGIVGMLIIVQGNRVAKLPAVNSRISGVRPTPWQLSSTQRFVGWVCVGMGLSMLIAAALVPVPLMAPVIVTISFATMATIVWHSRKVLREASPHA
jgi:hypothetical protein